ncbi:alpha-humulene 10-hydroxylase-like [Zingiber officinale]|uniref:alpha-humulene 10-hydroxylase-like n=1 Tax=Zingiber officinale TaxID=94328 RepID=UPI001C4D8851|nr:alpha-humulene 10-hydroxylase-like [Zingiber officinale]
MAMEANFLFSPSFITLFLGFFMALLVVLRRAGSGDHKSQGQVLAPLPPGPPRLPLIGNIHQIAGANPHRTLRSLARTHGPLTLLRLGQVNLVVASCVEAVEDIIKRHDLNFASRPTDLTFANILAYDGLSVAMAPYGGYWKQMRKIYAMELLNSRRVKSFATIREDVVRKMTAEIASKALAQTPLDLGAMLSSMANVLVVKTAFGERCKQQSEFLELVKEAVGLLTSFSVGDMYPSLKFLDTLTGLKAKLERVRGKLDKVFDEIMGQRQAAARADAPAEEDLFIDVLLRLRDEGGLDFPITTESIKAVVLEIFIGGTETSSSTIEWAMSELVKNPETMEKTQREIREAMRGKSSSKMEESDISKFSYLKLVIKETLRLHPPGPLMLPRVCENTCEVMGYRVPAGARVLINVFALGRDEAYWGADAESFKPERFESGSVDFTGLNFEFMSFGAGRRICPGMNFGLSAVEVGLAHLLFHFDWKLPHGMKTEDLDMMEISGTSAPRKTPLVVLADLAIPLP